MKIVSLSEFDQKGLELRSVFDHFFTLSRDEMFKKDSQEEKVDVYKTNGDGDEQRTTKRVIKKAMPIIYQSDVHNLSTENAEGQTSQKVKK